MRLTVNDIDYRHFTEFEIVLTYNAIASRFSFSGLKKFMPGKLVFSECEIYDDNNDLLITGIILSERQQISSKPTLFNVSGYSKPGVLNDSNLPIKLYPLQNDNVSLRNLADKILPYFDLDYEVSNNLIDFDKKLLKTNIMPAETLLAFFNRVASQLNIVVSHNAAGKVLFTRLEPDLLDVEYSFFEEQNSLINASMNFNGQNMHNSITVIRQQSSNPDAGESTLENIYVPVNRAKTHILNAGDIFTTEKAARTQLGNELRNISFKINTLQYVKPGSLIEFKAESFGIDNFIELFVEQTTIKANSKQVTYTLDCVIKDVYTDKGVFNIFETEINKPLFSFR